MPASTALRGTRSLQGSHPFWLGHDRVMADEFFRPFFGSGVWAQGEAVPGLWYNAMLGNNQQHPRRHGERSWIGSSPPARRCGGCRRPRSSAPAAPTATGSGTRRWRRGSASPRRGARSSASPTPPARPDNTDLRLADSVNVFDTGALAPGVTVDSVDYRILVVRCRREVQGHLPADRDLQPLARQLRGGRSAAGHEHPRHGLLRAGRVLPGAEEARSSTPRPRRSSATRTRASATAPSTWSGRTSIRSTPATIG